MSGSGAAPRSAGFGAVVVTGETQYGGDTGGVLGGIGGEGLGGSGGRGGGGRYGYV